MGMGWAPAAFETAGDWHLWLALTGVVVLCWGLVVAATATLFGRPAGGRHGRPLEAARHAGAAGSKKPLDHHAPQAGIGNG
ncbi:hypothetical protein MGAD_03320 [Mycolicibacterium gadium]|jgi:hypothetical protein|uniref:Uncharacterized protein n=1 Tax=Mycolicibacterium gadium TaxID=1794 RepID=A0A7I7WGL3_MYCGU|nr:hypothetical protein MGAD_03320 [Mycolicibacterium gadium]